MSIFFRIIMVLSVLFVFCSCASNKNPDIPTIGLFQFAPDPAIDNARNGFIKGLEDNGYNDGTNVIIEYKNAQADFMTIQTILDVFINKNVDLIVPLTTPCLQATVGKVNTTNVVFTAIYDPYIVGAAKSPDDHPANVTGVGSFPPVEETVELILSIFPDLKTLGTIRNTSELCSEAVVLEAREFCQKKGIELIETSISSSSEVLMAAEALADKDIDAFYIMGDNTVLTSFDSVVKVSREQRIPIIMNDPEYVERGALAAMGFDFYKSGYAGGIIAARVLSGESPADIPIQSVVIPSLALNKINAEYMGVIFTSEMIDKADLVIDK